MQLFSRLHKWMMGRPQKRSTPARQPASRFRPQLESLERRDVPSTLTVTSTNWLSPNGLRGAINAAANGDTIVFDPSLDGQTIQLSSQLIITKSLNIQGPGAGLLAIRPKVFAGEVVNTRIFEVASNVTVNVSGLTLEDGGGTESGVSILPGTHDPSPWDGDGGAILNLGNLTVSGCTLSGNSVSPSSPAVLLGGAIYNSGTLTVTGSTLSGNYTSVSTNAGRGGAIYNTGTAILNGCTLTDNIAGSGGNFGKGGAIFNQGTLTVSGCTISGNSATDGGGIFNATATGTVVTLTNDTVVANSATTAGGEGGGLYVSSASTVTLTNDTVKSNTATTAGGGIYIVSGAAVHLDAFTLANVITNAAPTDPNIDGSYLHG